MIILLGLLGACKPEAFISNPIEVKDLATEIEYIEHNLKTEGQDEGSYYLLDRMEHHKVPGVSITVVEAGQIKWSRAYGVSDSKTNAPIDTNTLFQAASISKPISALLALRLAEEGKVDLDENVNTYLEGWQVPDNEFTLTEKVSLRRLMSHSAGTSVHGFAGYKSSASIP
ncbi:MAG: serine hydrolase domain-containing protein, partial [Bacteroidota bacterium]